MRQPITKDQLDIIFRYGNTQKTDVEIGVEAGLSPSTVSRYRRKFFGKRKVVKVIEDIAEHPAPFVQTKHWGKMYLL